MLLLEYLLLFSHSVVSGSLWPHGRQHTRLPCPSPSPELAQTHVPGVGNAIETSHPLPPLFVLLSVFPSIRVFSNELSLRIRWPKYWSFSFSFSFSISPSNEYSGLISCRMDWLDLLAVQGILKSLLQHHSSKASIPWCSAFFMVQLSHPYMTTGKTLALTIWTFVGKVMSLLFSKLSRLVIAFFSKEQASFNFMAAITIFRDSGAQEKVCHCFCCFPVYLPWSGGTRYHDLPFLNVEF